MIICTECGASNGDDDQFCGACGEFLRWEAGEATARRSATDGAPRPRPGDRAGTGRTTDGRTGTDRSGDDRAGTGRTTDGPAETDGSDGGRAETHRTTDGPVGGGTGQPRSGTDGTAAERAATTDRAADVRTDDPTGSSLDAGRGGVPPARRPDGATADGAGPQPAPRQPGPPDRHGQPADPEPVPVTPADLPAHPPDATVACPACGVANPTGRRFCRSCGAQLAAPAAGPAPRRAWWQRWWERLRRRPRRRSLRDDRRAAGAARRTLLIVLALCLVGVLAVAGPPLARRAVEAVRDRTQDPTPLVPAAVTASSEAPGGRAARLTDGANNRYWAPNGSPVGSWVEGRFTERVRLLTVVITPGISPRRQAFLTAGRPRGLTVITVGADGRQRRTDIELRDEPGEQHFDIEASDVVRIRLVVRSTYGPGLEPSVAIGEVEFFGRR